MNPWKEKADKGRPILRLTYQQFKDLPEYSATNPTGTTIGKRWKRYDGAHDLVWLARGGIPYWVVGEYALHLTEPEKYVRIIWYKLVIIAPKI